MDIRELVETQKGFDESHNWVTQVSGHTELLDALQNDLIGLFGEVGEFSNLVKKALLLRNDEIELAAFLNGNSEFLKEEIADIFIYLIRIAGYMEIDLECEYLKKLKKNRIRFSRFKK